jgi:hypothetical protein
VPVSRGVPLSLSGKGPLAGEENSPCQSIDDTLIGARFDSMSASKTKSDLFQPIVVQSSATEHQLTPTSFRIRKNGIEFNSDAAVAMWTEMTVELQLPGTKSFACGGVVVACTGNRHLGYNVSLVFTSLTKQAQERLNDFSSIAAVSVRI